MQFFIALVIAFAAGFYTAQHVEFKIALKATSQITADIDGFDDSFPDYSTYKVE